MRRKLAIALASVVLALAGCNSGDGDASGANGAGSSDPYRVVFMGGLGSFVSGPANAQLNGLKAAAAKLNKSGGILGRPIEIEVIDTDADATKATSLLVERLAKDPKPDFVLPGTTSGETLALLPILTRHKILAIAESASQDINNPEAYPYGFSVSVGTTLPATALIEAVKKQGYKKLAIIGSNDAFGTNGVKAASDAAAAAGLAYESTTFPADALDVTPQLERLRASSPDVLIYTANGTQVSSLLRSRQKLGWDIPTIADLATGSGDIWLYAGGEPARGTQALVYPITPYVAPEDRPQPVKDLYAELAELGVPPYTSGIAIYALAWDILHLVAVAAEQAGTTDGPAVAKALENLQQPDPQPWTVFKDETFSPTSHFLAPDPSQFKLVHVGPTVDGMVQSAVD